MKMWTLQYHGASDCWCLQEIDAFEDRKDAQAFFKAQHDKVLARVARRKELEQELAELRGYVTPNIDLG